MHFYIHMEKKKNTEALLAVKKSFFKLTFKKKKRERKSFLHLALLRKAQRRTKTCLEFGYTSHFKKMLVPQPWTSTFQIHYSVPPSGLVVFKSHS